MSGVVGVPFEVFLSDRFSRRGRVSFGASSSSPRKPFLVSSMPEISRKAKHITNTIKEHKTVRDAVEYIAIWMRLNLSASYSEN